jgi:predicted small secreted protein
MNWYRIKIAGPYGYWMEPDGNLIPVQQHNTSGMEIAKSKHGATEKDIDDIYDFLFNLGYIRIITSNQSLYINTKYNTPSPTQIRVLSELGQQNGNVQGSFVTNVVINNEYPKNRQEFMGYLNK